MVKSSEERSKYGSIGGKVGGTKAYQERKGIHALTKEELKKISYSNVVARGFVPYAESEIRDAYLFSQSPENRHQQGNCKGKKNWKTVADLINNKYHNGKRVRSSDSLRVTVREYYSTHK